MTILVTGAAGFIGYHVSETLLARGEMVIGLDNLNDYYDVRLKQARLARLAKHPQFSFHQVNIADKGSMHEILAERDDITGVIHLAAQAGVRYSLTNPYAYVESNLLGQVVLLELARLWPKLKHFVYASSSSVYGGNTKLPFSIEDSTDHPVSLYAATKRSNELMGHTYAHLYKIPLTGLRFFTVYGPWGRPDMACFLFSEAICKGEPIKLFNNGQMQRDFTYIDDIVDGILATLDHPPIASDGQVPHRVYNLGNHQAEALQTFVDTLQQALGKKAIIEYAPMQKGDVVATYADIEASRRDLGFSPKTPISDGLPRFAAWYKAFYNIAD